MNKFSKYWQDSVSFLLGVLLLFSPWLFGFASEQAAANSAHVVGAIIAVTALFALFAFQMWEEWISGVLGAWLVVAPWVLNFSAHPTAMLTHVLIGIATIVLALWATQEHGAGAAIAGE